MARGYLFLFSFLSLFFSLARPQVISTDTPVPPFQWINLSPFLRGSSPPPLRDAALGYDEDSRSLVVFGGESEGGFVQSRTFLLNLDNLTWSTPSPPVNLGSTPAARSSAISGLDFAASNRHAFVVIGGKGANDVALSDVWAFDFTNHFWSEVRVSLGGPAPRWGASGGIDIRINPIQDQVLPGPNNSFYLAGGVDKETMFPMSDVWRLNISGILSANLPSSVVGSWEQLDIGEMLPGRVRQGGTIVDQRIISTGGCDTILKDENGDPSCAQQDSFVIDTQRREVISPGPCPPPRLDPVLVPNMNAHSSGFKSQVLLALGTLNTGLWNDSGGLEAGEVDILDVNTGSWSRILPAGDPASPGQAIFPTPREGAAVFSSHRALVGSNREAMSDAIMFGGRDGSGKYLNEMWLLRTYRAALSSSLATWSGYGDGRLQSGINADGSGVTIQYLTHCAAIRNNTDPSKDPDLAEPSPPQQHQDLYDIALSHKLLSPLSLALAFLSYLFLRLYGYSFTGSKLLQLRSGSILLLVIASFAIGIVGFVFAFTSYFTSNAEEQDSRYSQSHLKSPHAIASLVFFSLLYGAIPILCLLSFAFRALQTPSDTHSQVSAPSNLSPSPMEKPDPAYRGSSHSPSPSALYSPPLSPRPQSATLGHPSANPTRRSMEALSIDGESLVSASPRRGFEVLNRPIRTRKPSETWSASLGHGMPQPLPSSRSLGEIDWLLRRRSLNAVGELDYTLSVAHNAQRNSVTTSEPLQLQKADQLSCSARPPVLDIIMYLTAQFGFLGLNVITLIALWAHAPKATFIIFLIWVAVVYGVMIVSPRRSATDRYILSRIGRDTNAKPMDRALSPISVPPEPTPPTPLASGPYIHSPPFLRTVAADTAYTSRSTEGDDDDDIDDDARQRMIEEEMDRREVSIVTVPKRKLWVANPS